VSESVYKILIVNSNKELVLAYLKDMPLREKINGPLKKHLAFDITTAEYTKLMDFLDIYSMIIHGDAPEISYYGAIDMIETVEKAIDSIDRKFKEEGIE
jgi:hypothetical protein